MTFGAVAVVAGSSHASSDNVTTGVLGFLVVAAMGVALFFLLRSMNKQFKKIAPQDPPQPPPAGPADGPAPADGAETPAQRTG